MENQTMILFGSWIQAIGTFVAAVGSTPTQLLTKDQLLQLSVIGNVMQAVGNAVIADGETAELEVVGNQLQAVGNSTVVSGLLLDFTETTKTQLIIKGNLLQSLGGFTAIGESLDRMNGRKEALIVISGLLQGIGNSLQALGGMKELQSGSSESGQSFEFAGSWIQTVGSVLAAIEETKEWVMASQKDSSDSFVSFKRNKQKSPQGNGGPH